MKAEKLPSYGGQALIEGVLMRGSRFVASAMRNPQGEIVTHVEELPAIYQSKLKKIPFLRGLIILWDSLGLGMRFLTDSANLQGEENEKLEGPALYGTLIFSILFGVGLFFVLPVLLTRLAETQVSSSHIVSSLFEGFLRLAIMIGYLLLIRKMPEIRRVFQYHGAEHKTINAYESGAELTPNNVMRYSIEHPRCGTAFLLTLLVFSIILFTIIGPLPMLWRVASRVILVPILAGIAYEYIRWTASNLEHPIVRLLLLPNLALQKLTTIEPDPQIVEVAIAAFNTMLAKEQPELQMESNFSLAAMPVPIGDTERN